MIRPATTKTELPEKQRAVTCDGRAAIVEPISQQGVAFFYDLAIEQCKKAGFRRIVLRGHTAFSTIEDLDRWDESAVKFVLGKSKKPSCRFT